MPQQLHVSKASLLGYLEGIQEVISGLPVSFEKDQSPAHGDQGSRPNMGPRFGIRTA